MNRYSLIFALLMASSMVAKAPDPQTSHSSTSSANEKNRSAVRTSGAGSGSANLKPTEAGGPLNGPLQVIKGFLKNIDPLPHPVSGIKVLFVTVPHPIETHLAAEFDHNMDALQDGIQAAGYTYDSSYIPWARHEPRETFDDDTKERAGKQEEDALPGVLLFRRNDKDSIEQTYSNGLLVFLLTEKPTQGIRIDQVSNALSLLRLSDIKFADHIRILGPNYSGSLASLISVARTIHNTNPDNTILIRSGSVSGGDTAVETIAELSKQLPGTNIDFGSTQYNDPVWTCAALKTLAWIGIEPGSVATLSEGESTYGSNVREQVLKIVSKTASDDHHQRASTGKQAPLPCELKRERSTPLPSEQPSLWSLSFPRDISALRVGYENQGIFASPSPAQPWKRVLEVTSDDESEGDSVKSFGGSATIAAQESVLFGISEFLKAHAIRAVIVSATNEEDRYFLAQFLHAHNAAVRVVIIDTSRVFMRGATAQFRRDLVVADFPFFSHLHDWTRGERTMPGHVFADDVSQGTYFAAIDLLPRPSGAYPVSEQYPEYSVPDWKNGASRYPPMYVVALSDTQTWPVSEYLEPQFQMGVTPSDPGAWRVQMPFALLDGLATKKTDSQGQASQGQFPQCLVSLKQADGSYGQDKVRVARTWQVLFVALVFCVLIYCGGFCFANSFSHSVFASLEPSRDWRFWLFKVAIPALLFGGAFRLLSWTNEVPCSAGPRVLLWGYRAEIMTVLAPLAIAVVAAGKMIVDAAPRWSAWMMLALGPVIFHAIAFFTSDYLNSEPFGNLDVGSILGHYREMHWESGLSLVPTSLLFLLALFVWTTQAGNAGTILETAPFLPVYPGYEHLLRRREKSVLSFARPIPPINSALSLWLLWIVAAAIVLFAHFFFRPLQQITSLESHDSTNLLRGLSAIIVILLLSDLLQFVGLWRQLRLLLQDLDRMPFKRSFVPIKEFPWKNLWSFGGTSIEDRGRIAAAQIDCVVELAMKHRSPRFLRYARILSRLQNEYLRGKRPSLRKNRSNRILFFNLIRAAGNEAAKLVHVERYTPAQADTSANVVAQQLVCECNCESNGGRFKDEEKELARLPEWQQTAEKLICLTYISFIQTIVARLHALLISVASQFSLLALGFAIYPFTPFSPLLATGVILLAIIAWAFYKVFSEMQKDRALSRIVNGDDRKLEKEFYFKFAESLALPLLTLGSSFLPGGAGRLLEMVQALFSHGD